MSQANGGPPRAVAAQIRGIRESLDRRRASLQFELTQIATLQSQVELLEETLARGQLTNIRLVDGRMIQQGQTIALSPTGEMQIFDPAEDLAEQARELGLEGLTANHRARTPYLSA